MKAKGKVKVAADVAENSNPLALNLFDPTWPEKRRLLLERLANTTPGDPLMVGLLAFIEQSLLVQLRRCENPAISEGEARAVCNSIGLLLGLRGDLEGVWKQALTKRVNQG